MGSRSRSTGGGRGWWRPTWTARSSARDGKVSDRTVAALQGGRGPRRTGGVRHRPAGALDGAGGRAHRPHRAGDLRQRSRRLRPARRARRGARPDGGRGGARGRRGGCGPRCRTSRSPSRRSTGSRTSRRYVARFDAGHGARRRPARRALHRSRPSSCWPGTRPWHPTTLLAAAREVVGDLAEVTHSSTDALLEISAAGVSKATALARFAAERGVDAADVVAFGDMPNDLAMLAWAGRPYAVEGGHPEVLAAVEHGGRPTRGRRRRPRAGAPLRPPVIAQRIRDGDLQQIRCGSCTDHARGSRRRKARISAMTASGSVHSRRPGCAAGRSPRSGWRSAVRGLPATAAGSRWRSARRSPHPCR